VDLTLLGASKPTRQSACRTYRNTRLPQEEEEEEGCYSLLWYWTYRSSENRIDSPDPTRPDPTARNPAFSVRFSSLPTAAAGT
jgi:hypothetical protein